MLLNLAVPSDDPGCVHAVCKTLLDLEELCQGQLPTAPVAEVRDAASSSSTEDVGVDVGWVMDPLPPCAGSPFVEVTLDVGSGVAQHGCTVHRVTAEECWRVCAPRQIVGLSSCPVTLQCIHEDTSLQLRKRYVVRTTATASLGFLFHVTHPVDAVHVRVGSHALQTLPVPHAPGSLNRPFVCHLTDGGEDKTPTLTNLGLVLGDALAARCVWLTPATPIHIVVDGGGGIEGGVVHLLHLTCMRLGVSSASIWRNNFNGTPVFPLHAPCTEDGTGEEDAGNDGDHTGGHEDACGPAHVHHCP